MTSTGSNTPARPSLDLQALVGTEWEPRRPSPTLLRIRIEEIRRWNPPLVRVSRLRPTSDRYLFGWDRSWRLISVGRILTHYQPIDAPDIYGWIRSAVGPTPLRATRYDHILADDSVAADDA